MQLLLYIKKIQQFSIEVYWIILFQAVPFERFYLNATQSTLFSKTLINRLRSVMITPEVMKMNYAYLRVSTKEQCEDRQLDALQGLEIDEVFLDKASGKNFERPEYQKLLEVLKPGDLLVLHSIDRLGRNFEEILEQWRLLTKERQVHIFVITMPLLDTRKDNDLIGSLISNLVLQLLSFVAETERNSIKERQREGIAAAKARGKRFGRPRKRDPEQFDEVVAAWRNKELSLEETLQKLGMAKTTFYRRLAERKKGPKI